MRIDDEDHLCSIQGCYNTAIDTRYKNKQDICTSCYDKYEKQLGITVNEAARMMIKRAKDRQNLKYGHTRFVTLTPTDILKIWPSDNRCPILKIPFSVGGDLTNSPSLDRIDSNKEYSPDNIQVISYLANNMKNAATDVQLRQFAEYYYQPEDNMLDKMINNFVQWHKDRNLIDGSSDQAQYVKLIEEAGELAGNIARGKDVSDDIGDMIVILTNIAARNQLTIAECCEKAWNDIKDRKGKMVDGVFIKEE